MRPYTPPDIPAEVLSALQYPSNGDAGGSVYWHLSGANLPDLYPLTVLMRLWLLPSTGYRTGWFWASINGSSPVNYFSGHDSNHYQYVGMHGYPTSGNSSGTVHREEIAIQAQDPPVSGLDDNANDCTLTQGRWYRKAGIVTRVPDVARGDQIHAANYWDLDNGTDKLITFQTEYDYDDDLGFFSVPLPPTPALVFCDAPWAPNEEQCGGRMRTVQVFQEQLSAAEADTMSACETTEEALDMAVTLGLDHFFLNMNPVDVDDILDYSGSGRHGSWGTSGRPTRLTL